MSLSRAGRYFFVTKSSPRAANACCSDFRFISIWRLICFDLEVDLLSPVVCGKPGIGELCPQGFNVFFSQLIGSFSVSLSEGRL